VDVAAFLHDIQRDPAYAEQVVHLRTEPARAARFVEPETPLPEEAARLLAARGIAGLYAHQAAAWDAARRGEHVVVATGTASGKSLCYTLPLLDLLARDPGATALLLFPTKALCQDQAHRLREALAAAGLDVLSGVIDGDTPATTRRTLRDGARVILTNPDMLHAGILPQHARWAGFLSRLGFLVLDELHVYAGIFGSNVGNLFRRVGRVCAHYGSAPRVMACSATVGNPRELVEALVGQPFTAITDDGAPRGARTYLFWNPPVIRHRVARSRRSANVEAHELMAALVARGVRTITFSKAKMTAEMIHRYVCETLQGTAPHLLSRLAPYRGGFLPEERRAIEERLFTGELLGVSATRALELGIDVGGLDASIMVGYPGTLAAFFQQGGRAGRGADDALVILVGLDTPANQYVMRHPAYLFDRPVEEAVIDPDNPFVVTGHLRCAVQELPLADAEVPVFGASASLVLRLLEENLKVRHVGDQWYHATKEIPQHLISLRSYNDANVVIEEVPGGRILGEVDKFDAPPLLHPEAIYMHNGETYRVLSLDLERNIARVVRVETDYYTQPIGGTDVHHIDQPLAEKAFGTGRAFWGEVTAHFHDYGYEKVRFYELDALSRHGVDLPSFWLETMALWVVVPEALTAAVRAANLDPHNGLRGIGYATRMLLPLFMTCDTRDFSHSVGAVNAPWQALFIYERYPHGLGFTRQAYTRLHEILPAVRRVIRNCPCTDGCPCCTGKPLRGELVWNPERGEGAVPSKQAALMLLDGLLVGDLEAPDAQTTTESDAAAEIRLEQALRRRLERGREPQVLHPIAPRVETRYPDIEPAAELPKTDIERRIERRRDFGKALRAKLAQHEAPPEPPPPTPRLMGDDLAARARRLKRKNDS
jgi:DEAD/DEAH box helicase domain-containing protein